MRLKRYLLIFIVLFCFIFKTNGQNVSLFNQYNGRYDFTFIGNTLNEHPNGTGWPCETLDSSSATLNLSANDVIQNAYLYWAGSGTGDFNVKLNGIDITSQRNFSAVQSSSSYPFFSAFADVTALLQTTGNGNYTFSDLDVSSAFINGTYCDNATNFAGWAIVIVYGNSSLPLNQLNIYDGLETLSAPMPNVQDQLIINLGNLNVLDNTGAKLGFVAWEGDSTIANQESLLINGNPLFDPINPANNVFNGTNSILGTSDLYNMDLDIYDIQNSISVGNTSATIKMTTAQDYVMINAIVTKLNSQLPDATVVIDSIEKQCDSRSIILHYTISNLNATNPLPPGTPISIYANGILVGYDETHLPLDIGQNFNFQLLVVIPDTIPLDFEIKIVVDDTGNGTGIVTELLENNNTTTTSVSLLTSPTFNHVKPIFACNEGFTRGTFDFSSYEDLIKTNPAHTLLFYETLEDATNNVNPILNTTNYAATATPKEIFARISDENCFSVTSFVLITRNCPPTVYNYISVNSDARNDSFTIKGLHDIFLDFKLEVYNRWGKLVWTGNQNTENWDGYVKDGMTTKSAADGTYFYLLFLNDTDYPEPLKGYLYIKH